jgi:hypothetical protein
METLLAGIVLVVLGSLVAVFGVRVFFLLLPVWGFIAGFVAGAQLVAALLGEGFLATGLGWLAGIAVGIGFAILAGLWFWAAILILAASVGWALVAGLLYAIGFEPGVITVAAGLAGAAVLVVLAILVDAPILYIAVLTSAGGAAYAVAGALLALGRIGLDDLHHGALGAFRELPIAILAWLALAAVTLAYQVLEARGRSANLLARPGQPIAGA